MLVSLFPQAHARYSSLPVLGGSLDGLCVWLHARGYPRDAIQRRMGAAASLDRALRRRGCVLWAQVTASTLLSYAPPPQMFRFAAARRTCPLADAVSRGARRTGADAADGRPSVESLITSGTSIVSAVFAPVRSR